ncbi:MAG: tRNA (adenosine(37)-N6)-threonylcarbamoyltransferase complex ATPase subunit type 1 TsaE [Gammaproteobacteria bacterium]|jgi:tRNA threonylcarbamoyladenosine biosynthesis protein TsaE
MMKLDIDSAHSQEAFGAALAAALSGSGAVIHLSGPLGAGKTTLVRGLLRALGHEGLVRSPTYTLVEPYEFGGRDVFHLDLYRLGDPGELDYLGIRDLDSPDSICLVEWPERGGAMLPAPDLQLELSLAPSGRQAKLAARTGRGEAILQRLAGSISGGTIPGVAARL